MSIIGNALISAGPKNTVLIAWSIGQSDVGHSSFDPNISFYDDNYFRPEDRGYICNKSGRYTIIFLARYTMYPPVSSTSTDRIHCVLYKNDSVIESFSIVRGAKSIPNGRTITIYEGDIIRATAQTNKVEQNCMMVISEA